MPVSPVAKYLHFCLRVPVLVSIGGRNQVSVMFPVSRSSTWMRPTRLAAVEPASRVVGSAWGSSTASTWCKLYGGNPVPHPK